MEIFVLLFLLLSFVIYGVIEFYKHQSVLTSIPIRIHVNGARGKSSVTRLIAAGLRAGGIKTIAKTTGSAPRIIDSNGEDHIIHRIRAASIGEQIKLIKEFSKQKPKAIVMECMAVQPEYQWVTEQKMMRSTIGVITNVRPDHLDEMGYDLESIALSLSNTIPYNSKFITAEEKIVSPLKTIAVSRNSSFHQSKPNDVSKEYMIQFPFLEHAENVSLALKVCEQVGINRDVALNGMIHTKPDPGALEIINIKSSESRIFFVNAFAANDPHSTFMVWNMMVERFPDTKKCIFLNTREDRLYRTNQLLDLCFDKLKPEKLIIRGDNILKLIPDNIDLNVEYKIFSSSEQIKTIINHMKNYNNFFIMGIGNIVGWGDDFIEELKK